MALDAAFNMRAEEQVKLAHRLGPIWADFSKSWRRYNPENVWFMLADAAVYYSMLTTIRPKRIIEIGCGFSSSVALDVRDQELHDLELTCIDPNPERLLGLLNDADKATVTVHRSPAENIAIETFDVLEENDILFIDSSHISKSGSDVNFLYFQVLPRLRPGVVVHIHDFYYPFEYPAHYLAAGCIWNELYVLYAFLCYNNVFQVMFFNHWFWQEHSEIVKQYLPQAAEILTGSIWLRRVA